MKFDDHLITQIRNSVDIVEVIGSYVQLKKSGQNFMALCPFHNEKTPSFSVSGSKQIFKCFGCGVGGDVFQFVSQIERLSFPETIEHLAQRSGIPLPQQGVSRRPEDDRRPRLLEIMRRADEFFRGLFKEAAVAKRYLEERRIGADTIRRFGLGYAPGGNQVLSMLRAEGFSHEDLESCGLIKRGETGDYYDKFRNRVTFPIQDLSGRTIAFGGRSLGDAHPKYLNSPETPLYVKGNHLYGLNLTQTEIRRRDFAILVEGYFDCIVPFQFGIPNAVASLGTSLTSGQVKLLGRYTRNVVVNFDPDSAGLAAAMRSVDLFLEGGFHVNVLHLPAGEDPDSFILKYGADAYSELLTSSSPYLDFVLSHLLSQQRDPGSPKGKQEVVSAMLPYLIKVPNRIERSEYVSKVAGRLRVREELLIQEMRRLSRRGPQQELSLTPGPQLAATISENTILAALLELDEQNDVMSLIVPELFEGLRTEKIFAAIFEFENQNREISVLTLRDALEPSDMDLLERVVLGASGEDFSLGAIEASVSALRDVQINRLSEEIQGAIVQEEESGEVSGRVEELLRKKETLRRQQAQR